MDGTTIALLTAVAGVAVGIGLARFFRPRGSRAAGTEGLEARLELQSAELRRLADLAAARDGAGESLRSELAGARRALDQLADRESERREREVESWAVVGRLSTVLAGGASKGRAGENVLRERLLELPPGMLTTDFRVNGKVVEFGLLLPDGRRLPVDSKWSALAELEALESTEDPAERERSIREVERTVSRRVGEVAQYLDPALTAPVAVAAVPDAVYEVLRRTHAEAFAHGVVIVPYASALPILLFLYSLVDRFGDAGDVKGCLADVSSMLDAMEGILENKIARAATMVANGADEFRGQLGKARGSVARARASGPPELERPAPGVLEVVP